MNLPNLVNRTQALYYIITSFIKFVSEIVQYTYRSQKSSSIWMVECSIGSVRSQENSERQTSKKEDLIFNEKKQYLTHFLY